MIIQCFKQVIKNYVSFFFSFCLVAVGDFMVTGNTLS